MQGEQETWNTSPAHIIPQRMEQMNAVYSNSIAAPINVTKTEVTDQDIFAWKLAHNGITSESDFLYCDRWFMNYSKFVWSWGNAESLCFGMWNPAPDMWLTIHEELDRMIAEFGMEEAA